MIPEPCIGCGNCVRVRSQRAKQVLNSIDDVQAILRCRQAGMPITNYGMCIAYSLGIFERALAPFPAAMETYRELRNAVNDRT